MSKTYRPPRRRRVFQEDKIDRIQRRLAECDATFAERVAWAKENYGPDDLRILPTPAEWRRLTGRKKGE
jgi:hypothetical protein